MSYRDPQRVIDNRMNTINKGIQSSLMAISKSRQAFAAAEKQKLEKAQDALNKVGTRAQISFDNAYQTAQDAANTFTSGLVDKTGKSTKDAINFTTQIEDILSSIGNDLNNKIKDIQKNNGSADQINKAKNEAIAEMKKFTNDMANWETARVEYMKASQIEKGKPGSLMDNVLLQKNPNMLTIFNDIFDKEENLYISRDPANGNTRISQGKMVTENGKTTFKPTGGQTEDLTALAANIGNKDGYFIENEEFDAKGYDQMEGIVKLLRGNKVLLIDGKNELDKEKVRDYLLGYESETYNVNLGTGSRESAEHAFMNGYRNEPRYWASLGVDNEDAYLNKIFDVGFDLYFQNTPANIENNKNIQSLNG